MNVIFIDEFETDAIERGPLSVPSCICSISAGYFDLCHLNWMLFFKILSNNLYQSTLRDCNICIALKLVISK